MESMKNVTRLSYNLVPIWNTLIIQNTNIKNSPASYQVSGVVRMKPILLSSLIPVDIDIPFKARARNQRFE